MSVGLHKKKKKGLQRLEETLGDDDGGRVIDIGWI